MTSLACPLLLGLTLITTGPVIADTPRLLDLLRQWQAEGCRVPLI